MKLLHDILSFMRLKKDGSVDKRFKDKKTFSLKDLPTDKDVVLKTSPEIDELRDKLYQSKAAGTITDKPQIFDDPQETLNNFLRANNMQLDFDVIEGTIPTTYGFVKLDKPTLVVKAVYVESK